MSRNSAVSLIIVSHRRHRDLERAMASLVYQSLRNFEVIVVADRPPLVHDNFNVPLKYVEYSDANISRARNLGLAEAKAPLVAFCDDDAVPDPFWLERLIAPFYAEKTVGAAGGYVRGRNGLSYQWQGIGFYRNAEDFSLEVDTSKPWTIYSPELDRFVKTVGTNCAFRRAAVFEVGGYDEGFHYYLDDTDINLRLQEAGWSTAIVPDAQVIHNYAQSRGRKDNRVPQSLYNIGASTNLFLRKHCPERLEENLALFFEAQQKRLARYFYFGVITKKQSDRLLRDLNNGLFSGVNRNSIMPLKPVKNQALIKPEIIHHDFQIHTHERPKLSQITEYPIYLTTLYTSHAARLGFHRKGYWRMVGGRFGRIERKGRFWRYRTPSRYREEIKKALMPHFSA